MAEKQDPVAVEELQSFGSGNPLGVEVEEMKKFATVGVAVKRDQSLAVAVEEVGEYQRQQLAEFPYQGGWEMQQRLQWVWWEAEEAFQVAHPR